MERKNIIVGQKITSEKHQRSKQLRLEMTPEEKILWEQLRRNNLNGLHFRRQQIIDGFIVDFYCHQAQLVIEVDGEIHDLQVESDQERDAILAARGLKILRIKNQEIRHNLQSALQKIINKTEDIL
ncbi:endonuclease domain-containing protein [Planktothrix sp.]|uniref:endonuclease domain-containing protein n=1 Tax=Planktothrix sp. TaxID=3088171 RepID=UPI0038D4F0BC